MRLSPDMVVTDTGTDLVLLNERTGRYFSLNGTGRAVLLALADGSTPEDAAEDLTRRHPDAAERIAADVPALVEALLREKVLLP
ncbi:lasso peptide biosynthesis PqqD family chaperone [Actinomadura logoneensis]|uniref:Lasso peptide biosynthesis PqqD family chaperone n=1 Tax=Actinomadura logoneensis TaxID=2293572 RepID=A0A372JDF6_9ACTN|nr:lasso peptide biosynthesis PqqD family chaperone [Actinomadura logoneensis]RFU37949.1 lasso peptide biosynthesis PqqD family chaperone [Actinomadura logoneensis]